MSIQTLMNQKSFKIDKLIQNKFETILTDQIVGEDHLNHPIFDLVGGMIYSPQVDADDYSRMDKGDVIQLLEIKKQENSELINLFNDINKERRVNFYYSTV